LSLHGQRDRYMVFFADKEGSVYSVDNPGAFLSDRSLERRSKNGIAVTIQDFPVNEDYLENVTATGADVYFTSRWMNGALIQATEQEIAEVEALDEVTEVELVAPDSRLSRGQQETPDAGPFQSPELNGLNTDDQLQMLGIQQMHVEGNYGEGVLIAVMDGGFRSVNQTQVFEHLYEEERVLFVKDFVTNGFDVYQYSNHGTSVLSCIASFVNDSISGVAPAADYMLFVTEDVASEYRIEEYNWLFAAELADSIGVDIINTSLGYSDFEDPSMDYLADDLDGQTAVITRAAEIAYQKGILVVTSVGNSGDLVSSPADGENALSIGSVRLNNTLSSFSSVGPTADNRIKPDVVAPGEGVTVFSNTGFRESSGTSFSAPFITGLAAGLYAANPDWTVDQVKTAIRQSGGNAATPNNLIGYGLPNFRPDLVLQTSPKRTDIKIYPNPTYDKGLVNIELSDDAVAAFDVGSLLDAGGKKIFSFSFYNREYVLDMSSFRSGNYFIHISGPERTEIFQLIKN